MSSISLKATQKIKQRYTTREGEKKALPVCVCIYIWIDHMFGVDTEWII